MLGFGLKTRRFKNVSSGLINSVATQNFLNRLVPYPDVARERIYATFIDGLISAGLDNHFDFLAVNCAVNGGTALTNIWNSTYQGVRVEITYGLTFSANDKWHGGSSGDHISSQFNPATAISPKYTLNDAMVGFWSSDAATVGDVAIFAATTGSPQVPLTQLTLFPKLDTGRTMFCINGAANINRMSPFDSDGLFIAQRTASNACAVYRNNSLILSSSQASSSVPNGDIRFRCAHPTRIMFIGKSMNSSQRASFQTLCENLITSIVGSLP